LKGFSAVLPGIEWTFKKPSLSQLAGLAGCSLASLEARALVDAPPTHLVMHASLWISVSPQVKAKNSRPTCPPPPPRRRPTTRHVPPRWNLRSPIPFPRAVCWPLTHSPKAQMQSAMRAFANSSRHPSLTWRIPLLPHRSHPAPLVDRDTRRNQGHQAMPIKHHTQVAHGQKNSHLGPEHAIACRRTSQRWMGSDTRPSPSAVAAC
jgi:hypothetical protein